MANFLHKDIFTTYEVAKICHANITSIKNWITKGKIKAFKTPGGHFRIRRSDLIEFLNRYSMPNPFEDLGKKKILMIDKTKAILNKLKEKLDTKYEFIHSPDSYKALLLIGSDKPQLVIIDAEVNGLGYENVCKTIKENKELKKIKVVVFGLEQKQITPENLKVVGANKLIKRGAKINTFLSAIEQLIE